MSSPFIDSQQNPFQTQAKMLWHLDRLAQWHLYGDTFPVLVEVNLINICNQACRWCISSYSHLSDPALSLEERATRAQQLVAHPAMAAQPSRWRGLDIPTLARFLVQAQAKGLRGVTWSGGGEPTVHSQFPSAVAAAAEAGLEQGLMTNGMFPGSFVPTIGEHVRWVRVSLDTMNPTAYAYQKRTSGFPRVVSNLHELVAFPVKVGVNMNVDSWNVDEILALGAWCRDIGIDYFQIRPVLDRPAIANSDAAPGTKPADWWARLQRLLCEAESLSTDSFRVVVSWDKFIDVAVTERATAREYTQCVYHFFTCVLNADGDLAVCMYHLGDRSFSFGNIYEQSVAEIWHSARRREVIDMCLNKLDLATCQVCCKGHEINKLLHFVTHPDPTADINFL